MSDENITAITFYGFEKPKTEEEFCEIFGKESVEDFTPVERAFMYRWNHVPFRETLTIEQIQELVELQNQPTLDDMTDEEFDAWFAEGIVDVDF